MTSRNSTAKSQVIQLLKETGDASLFFIRTIKEGIVPPYEWRELIRQCYLIGYKSLPLVAGTAFIIGLVLTIQSRPTMILFGAGSMVPSMVGVSIIREIGPVVTALIFAGRVGSSIGAELGSMKVTEQIDAIEVSGTNPIQFLIGTRIMATTLTLPILVLLADTIGLLGSFTGVRMKEDISLHLYFSRVFESLAFPDFFPALIKSFLFGAAIGTVACYKGYSTSRGTEGVGKAANTSVVQASMLIFIIDLIVVQVTDALGYTL
jgi:phospholipid/cholesterol/gamma-HCH transport system permease protein